MSLANCSTVASFRSFFMAVAVAMVLTTAGTSHAQPTTTTTLPPTDIHYGEILADQVCNGGDLFRFEGNSQDRVVVHVASCSDASDSCTPSCCCFDQCVTLQDPNRERLVERCTPINTTSCSRRPRTSVGPMTLGEDGEHFVNVRDRTGFGGGTYVVFVQDVANPAQATRLNNGVSQLGNIQQCGQVDTYVVAAQAGQQIAISMAASTVGEVLPRLEMYGPGGILVALADVGELAKTVITSGDYTVLAFSTGAELGTYDIRAEVGEPPTTTTTTTLEPATTTTTTVAPVTTTVTTTTTVLGPTTTLPPRNCIDVSGLATVTTSHALCMLRTAVGLECGTICE